MSNDQQLYLQVAACLDGLEAVPSDALRHVLSRDGTCMWVYARNEQPQWTGDDRRDRELAAPICAACPVQRECLEFEFRTARYATASVWGPLPADQRRATFLAWLERRDDTRPEREGVVPHD